MTSFADKRCHSHVKKTDAVDEPVGGITKQTNKLFKNRTKRPGPDLSSGGSDPGGEPTYPRLV